MKIFTKNPSMLYIISTPIGNLEDITLRAIRLLKEVDLIAAEDTRKTGILTKYYGINTEMTSYHSHNIRSKTPELIKKLEEGKNIAVVSDSGTPGISDPGSVLVAESIKRNIPVTAVPGAAAIISALVLSGKPTHKFVFEGFLSNKKVRRRKQLETFKDEERTVILYESPHRIIKFLDDFRDIFGEKEVVLARELTKKFEEVRRGPARHHLQHFSQHPPKGEFVVVF
jgi:16S rRNA (cytidine1402-2'-O)-methyltransferase